MAERFVLVTTNKWHDPWYRQLTLEQRQAWNYLTEYPDPTQTGIIERLPQDMAFECQIDSDVFNEALNQFERDGRIAREGNCLLVVKWFQHQRRRPGWDDRDKRCIGAEQELDRLRNKCPQLVDIFEGAYKGLTRGLQGASLKEKKREEKKREESSEGSDAGASSRTSLKPQQAKYLPLADVLKAAIDATCAKHQLGNAPANPQEVCAAELEKIVRLDGLNEEQIRRAMLWALEDEFWQPQVLSIRQLRKVSPRNGRKKIQNVWASYQKQHAQESSGSVRVDRPRVIED